MTNLRFYLTEKEISPDEITFLLKRDCAPYLKQLKGIKNFIYRGTNHQVERIRKFKARENRTPTDTDIRVHNMLDSIFRKKFGWKARSEGVFTSSDTNLPDYGTTYLFFPIGQFKYLWSPKIDDLYGYLDGQDIYYNYIENNIWNPPYENWDELYGEGGTGTYEYDGIDIGHFPNYTEALDYIKDKFKEEEPLRGTLEWIPDVSEDAYHQELEERLEQDLEQDLEDFLYTIIDGYKSNDLKGAIKSKHEIMFKCKEYYLVDEELGKEIINII